MTKSFRVNRRKAVALTLALASTSAFAITGPAQAELGPNIPTAGDVRVTPAGTLRADGFSSLTDGLNQQAPVIALGTNDQPAAGAQIRIHNQWRAGDRVLLQVRASDGENCANVAKSIGYSAVPTVESSDIAYTFAGNSPMASSNPLSPGDNDADSPPATLADTPVPAGATVPQVKPQFQVNLLSSTQCAPNGITDLVEILFTNQSAVIPVPVAPTDPGPGATPEQAAAFVLAQAAYAAQVAARPAQLAAAWVLSMDGIAYDVGTDVTAGPLRNLPLAQNATATPGNFINTPGEWFGGNLAAIQTQPLVQELWTTTAFIVPVSLTAATPGVLIDDNFNQDLGTITFAESRANGLFDGNYQVCYSNNIGALSTVPTATGPVVAGSISISGRCINFTVDATAASDTIVFSNIIGTVVGAGAVTVSLTAVPPIFVSTYLTATDNGEPLSPSPDDFDPLTAPNVGDPLLSNSAHSDVNVVQSPYLIAPLAVAQALPDRIGGNDRFETASKIAYSTTTCADFVVLVNGNSFPDSLSASYLAGALTLSEFNGGEGVDEVPILTTSGTSLHPAAELAIRELGVRTVYIVGGPAAVSADVAAAVDALPRADCGGAISDTTQTVQIDRIAGADRYATNRTVVQRAQSILDGDSVNYNSRIRYQANAGVASERTALLASGSNFADALSAGPISFGDSQYGFPLVLTTPNTLSPDAALTLANLDITQVVVVGGPAAVSAGVVASLEALGIDVIRLAGADRYETAIQVLMWAATEEFPNDQPGLDGGEGFNLGLEWPLFGDIVLARGDDFADALAVAPYVASRHDLLVLTTPKSLHPAAGAFISTITSIRDSVGAPGPRIVAIGLGAAISGDVVAQANALANP